MPPPALRNVATFIPHCQSLYWDLLAFAVNIAIAVRSDLTGRVISIEGRVCRWTCVVNASLRVDVLGEPDLSSLVVDLLFHWLPLATDKLV